MAEPDPEILEEGRADVDIALHGTGAEPPVWSAEMAGRVVGRIAVTVTSGESSMPITIGGSPGGASTLEQAREPFFIRPRIDEVLKQPLLNPILDGRMDSGGGVGEFGAGFVGQLGNPISSAPDDDPVIVEHQNGSFVVASRMSGRLQAGDRGFWLATAVHVVTTSIKDADLVSWCPIPLRKPKGASL